MLLTSPSCLRLPRSNQLQRQNQLELLNNPNQNKFMKKNHYELISGVSKIWKSKFLKRMRIVTLLILISITQTFALDVYAQNKRLSLDLKNETIINILEKIEDQSEFYFMFDASRINVNQRKSVDCEKQLIGNILDQLFENTGITYSINDRQILLTTINESDTKQQNSISGKVTDSFGSPLPGVTVLITGTTNGTVTNSDGGYSLANIPEDATLQFSFVGMKTQEVQVVEKTIINVMMEEETIGLDEVVAIGYGTMKKSDLTGSLSQVREDVINSLPTTNVMQSLVGRASGVQVVQNTGAPGASVSIRIRGANSIKGSNEPLYVVDGFPVDNKTALSNTDIESIEILKDASATAIYGSRGANGVVLITTKQGNLGQTNVDFEYSYSIQTLRKKMDLMNAKEYAMFYNEQQMNDAGVEYFSQDEINDFGEGTDWQDIVFQKAPMQTSSLNINGGNNKTRFSLSGSILEQDGIIEASNYKRYSLHTSINHEISKKFSATINSVMTQTSSYGQNSGGGNRGSSLISATVSAPPTLTPYNEDGTYRVLSSAYSFIAPDIINPLNWINEQTDHVKANIVIANAALIYKPIEDLTIRFSGGIENSDSRSDYYKTTQYINSSGEASVTANQFTSLLNENTISYKKTFNENHHISALAGFTYQDFLNTSLGGSGTGFLSDVYQTYDLSAASTSGIPSSSYSKSVILSYLGRINYSYRSRYLLTASFRADGSSKYSKGNKWGYFPSGAFAWRVSDEKFLKNETIISDLKFRLSWGLTGSQAISAYSTLSQMSSNKVVFNDDLYNAFAPGTTLSGDLKWETTDQKDVGIDLAILNNRFNLTADFYIKNTRDLLNTVSLPLSNGYTSAIKNVGEVQNKGLELSFNADILNGQFKWNINSNISFNRNKVVKLYNGEDILGGNISVTIISDATNILREGRPIGQFWGYLEDGYDSNGDITYKDLEPDGTIDSNDKTYIGDPNPDFIYGLNSTMSYKDFELTIFLQGSQGNDLFNASAISNTLDYAFGLNMPKDVYTNHWSPTNTKAKYPIISYNITAKVSDRFIEDGSYLRLKNIQMAYNFPIKKLGINWIQSAQIYLSGQNLLTLTKYSWWDPEINTYGGSNSTAQGIDHSSYPVAKAITFGIRARF